MWTKNEYGKPFCWVNPAHKIERNEPVIGSFARDYLADQLLPWFNDAMEFLHHESWTFEIDKKGKYLPGIPTKKAPEEFRHEAGNWTLTLRVLSEKERVPHRQSELTDARQTLHKVVTVILMNLVGSAMAGRMLGPHRAAYGLPKLRKSDIWGKQNLLF